MKRKKSKQWPELQRKGYWYCTLDSFIQEDFDHETLNLADPHNFLDDLDWKFFREGLKAVLSTLTLRENRVITARFFDELTLDQTGKIYGISRERVRQIEAKALRKLRQPTRSNYLRNYLLELFGIGDPIDLKDIYPGIEDNETLTQREEELRNVEAIIEEERKRVCEHYKAIAKKKARKLNYEKRQREWNKEHIRSTIKQNESPPPIIKKERTGEDRKKYFYDFLEENIPKWKEFIKDFECEECWEGMPVFKSKKDKPPWMFARENLGVAYTVGDKAYRCRCRLDMTVDKMTYVVPLHPETYHRWLCEAIEEQGLKDQFV